jgi:hypothetical protein
MSELVLAWVRGVRTFCHVERSRNISNFIAENITGSSTSLRFAQNDR